jgi:hypothetical protein
MFHACKYLLVMSAFSKLYTVAWNSNRYQKFGPVICRLLRSSDVRTVFNVEMFEPYARNVCLLAGVNSRWLSAAFIKHSDGQFLYKRRIAHAAVFDSSRRPRNCHFIFIL